MWVQVAEPVVGQRVILFNYDSALVLNLYRVINQVVLGGGVATNALFCPVGAGAVPCALSKDVLGTRLQITINHCRSDRHAVPYSPGGYQRGGRNGHPPRPVSGNHQ